MCIYIYKVKIFTSEKNEEGEKLRDFLLLEILGYEVFAKQKKKKLLTYHYSLSLSHTHTYTQRQWQDLSQTRARTSPLVRNTYITHTDTYTLTQTQTTHTVPRLRELFQTRARTSVLVRLASWLPQILKSQCPSTFTTVLARREWINRLVQPPARGGWGNWEIGLFWRK